MAFLPTRSRITTEAAAFLRRVNGRGAAQAPAGTGSIAQQAAFTEQRQRQDDYDLRDKLLEGTAFLPVAQGGALKTVLKSLRPDTQGNETLNPIVGYYNPVPGIVGCYQNCLGGAFGKELTLADEPKVSPAVKDALAKLWRWSNLDALKSDLCQLAANQGTVGIRVVFEPGATADDSRVYLQLDRPQTIADVDFDARGNVTAVLLRRTDYYSPQLGFPERPVEVWEEIRKDGFSLRLNRTETLDEVQQQNPLGVCPYVLLRHDRRPGDVFGRHAYAGTERAILGINWLLSQPTEAAARALSETIFMSGSGPKPQRFPLGRVTVLYAQTAQGVPPPGYESITPQLEFDGVRNLIDQAAAFILERQPELALDTLKLFGNLSGEALAQALKRAEVSVLRARALYEDALIRALQIGLSYGVLYGLWNLGTGQGTPDAAERAYGDGAGVEAFAFAEREALPLTPAAKVQQANANEAENQAKANTAKALDGIVSRRYQLEKVLGLPPNEVTKILDEQAAVDTLPTVQDGAANPADRGQQTAAQAAG